MKLYAITDRRLFAGDETERCAALLRQAARWVGAGVDFIQLREKDLSLAALEELACELSRVRDLEHGRSLAGQQRTRILVNCVDSLAPGAIESVWRAGADGIHLGGALDMVAVTWSERLERVRSGWPGAPEPIVSVACHSIEEAWTMREARPSVVLFAPVFGKQIERDGGRVLPGTGLETLAGACSAAWPVPVFALGGVTVDKAGLCVDRGAAGVAGIRLFAGDSWRGLAEI